MQTYSKKKKPIFIFTLKLKTKINSLKIVKISSKHNNQGKKFLIYIPLHILTSKKNKKF